ncbi:MAG: hypothetical protein WB988_12370 [Candidatus Nitrosopolaris sp.]|jgi:hypothetical protein
MTIGLKFATIITALTPLIVSGILVAAASISATVQGSSSSSSGDPTSFLQSAKMHLTEAMKDIKMANSEAALTQINMANQAITLAGLKLNATIICNNIRNEGYCVAP